MPFVAKKPWALAVLLALAICCTGAMSLVADAIGAGESSCCEKQCADTPSAPCAAVLTAEKRGADRPDAIAAILSSVITTPMTSADSLVALPATGSRLFSPLRTIVLRI